ncbi:MAG: translocation/assembly module TamB domain-containing protein, partial [Bacteroidota bacterium]|nr:translocation/assembly module TamB domain-containing protein [Bacteroidota bacterium]
ENPDAILTNNEEDSYTVSGFTIDANFGIEKGAVFNLVIDEQTGDNFQVSGNGDFEFDMYPNGRMTLSGRYDVTDGHYEMSLYNLVNRRFELAPDSRITWSGDPFDADLDIKAYYSVETSASGLMASQTSGADISTQMQYRQEVPFQVYININGELMQPIISFNLDIPEGSRGAVGGQVYSRVQQLNQQENELNKQVFSLLVLNRFFPTSSSDGSSGGTAAIARDNLNDAISDQLNMFSDKLLGDTGFNLNFGLDSYTDYQGSAPTDRTTLDIAAQKSLFNDRVVVSVGSAVDLQGSGNTDSGNAPVVGNVSIEYLLTEDGRYRLRGYRSSQFENIIDGQIIVNGISLQFTREFNKFTELWQSMFPAKTEEEEDTNE